MNADIASPDLPAVTPLVPPTSNGAGVTPEPGIIPQYTGEEISPERAELEQKKLELQNQIHSSERNIIIFRQGLVIFFFISSAVLFLLNEAIFTSLANALHLRSDPLALLGSLPAGMRFLVVWFYYGLFFYALGLLVELPLKKRREDLAGLDEQIMLARKRTFEGRLEYLQEKIQRLTHEVARVFLDNQAGSSLANQWIDKANHLLADLKNNRQSEGTENRYFSIGHADSLITQIYELKLREEKELRQQRNWQWIAVGIMLFYIFALAMVILMFPEAARSDQSMPLYGIPLSVVMWGATGSLGAILYRFYEKKDRVRFDVEVRWLIARPVIGIIMGGLAYLAISTGLLLLNRTAENTGTPGRLEAYWIFAFLAGFSDKFYRRIINLLVDKTVGEDKPNKDKTKDDTKKTTSPAAPVENKLKSIAKSRHSQSTKKL